MSVLPHGERAHRVRLAWALALSVALHAWALQQRAPLASSWVERLPGSPPAIQLRFVREAEPQPGSEAPGAAREEPGLEIAERADPPPVPPQRRDAAADMSASSAQSASPDGLGGLPRQYFPASDLDRTPAALEGASPAPPVQAVASAGRVVLRLLINEQGGVDQALVDESHPPGQFDRWAVVAFRQVKFTPGIRKGEPVKSQLRIEIMIDPAGVARH